MSLQKFEKKLELVLDVITPEYTPFGKQCGKRKKKS